jgi:hypothetical protein
MKGEFHVRRLLQFMRLLFKPVTAWRLMKSFVNERIDWGNDNHRARGTGENEWYTPAKYIDDARKVLGQIDLDPATSDSAGVTPRWGHRPRRIMGTLFVGHAMKVSATRIAPGGGIGAKSEVSLKNKNGRAVRQHSLPRPRKEPDPCEKEAKLRLRAFYTTLCAQRPPIRKPGGGLMTTTTMGQRAQAWQTKLRFERER